MICGQCDYFTCKWDLTLHKKSLHEGLQYICGQCDYNFTCKGDLTLHKKSLHKIYVINVTIILPVKGTSHYTKNHYTKESNIYVVSVTIAILV